MKNIKIILSGGAGVMGQNLVAQFKAKGYSNIDIIYKHQKNLEVLKKVQLDVLAIKI